MRDKQRITWIDNARALSALWVICAGHLNEYIVPNFHNDVLTNSLYGALAVFTFLPGFCLSKYRIDDKTDVINFYKKRILRIIPLFLVSLFTLLIVSEVFGFSYVNGPKQFLFTATGLSMFVPPSASTVWYVSMLIVFYLMTPYLLKISKVKNQVVAFLAVAILFVGLYEVFAVDVRMAYLWPAYSIGLLLGKNNLMKYTREKITIPIAAVFGTVVLLSNYLMVSLGATDGGGVLAIVIMWVFELSFVVFSYKIIQWIPKGMTNILKNISYGSFCIYLFHRQFFATIFSLMGDGAIPLWLAYLVLLPILCVICYYVQHGYDLAIKSAFTKKRA